MVYVTLSYNFALALKQKIRVSGVVMKWVFQPFVQVRRQTGDVSVIRHRWLTAQAIAS